MIRILEKEKRIETVIPKSFPHHPKIYTTLSLKTIPLLISIKCILHKLGPETLPNLQISTLWSGSPLGPSSPSRLSFSQIDPRGCICFPDRFPCPQIYINAFFHCQIDLGDIECTEKGEKNLQILNFISLFFFFNLKSADIITPNSLSIYLRPLKEKRSNIKSPGTNMTKEENG